MKTSRLNWLLLQMLLFFCLSVNAQSWKADNGNGTYTNPLFFEEFSDPTMVRVGEDFYLTGTTNHVMPGLPLLHSKDLVNWRLIGYAMDRLDLGPDCRLEENKQMYGQGIWAPSFTYHDGTFRIFANVNKHMTQIYESKDINGPWKHSEMKCSLHDLSVFFDDDQKPYVTWGARILRMAQLSADLTDTIPGTTRVVAKVNAEGSHLYKIRNKYYIIWAVPGGTTPMLCGKADAIYGPYEIVPISENDFMGVSRGHFTQSGNSEIRPMKISNSDPKVGLTLHQGGIIDTPTGEWWGYSMQDHNSVGRVLNLAPVTWQNDFPYFGLPGNLTKSPRTWTKPNVGKPQQPIVSMMDRADNFSKDKLMPAWQWNHVPVETKWSLTENPGYLRLHSLPAKDFWWARNSLTQRSIGPVSITTVELRTEGLKSGDQAGLALLNNPYAWIGAVKEKEGLFIRMFDNTIQNEADNKKLPEVRVTASKLYLRVTTDFLTEKAQFRYSIDDKLFYPLGREITMSYNVQTFQGVRIALFNYNRNGVEGGYADFDNFNVEERYPNGLVRPVPFGKTVVFTNKSDSTRLGVENNQLVSSKSIDANSVRFKILDRGNGRVALQAVNGKKFISVDSEGAVSLKDTKPDVNETFQWIELEGGDLVLLSLVTNRYLSAKPGAKVNALESNPAPSRVDGSSFTWTF